MNTENRKHDQSNSPSARAATNVIKVAAWAVIAGGMFAGPAWAAQVTSDIGPADESVAAVDNAPVAQPGPTTPAPKIVEPTTPQPTVPAPVTPAPTTPAPTTPAPTTPADTTPPPATPAPATPAPTTPAATTPDPEVAKPTTAPAVAPATAPAVPEVAVPPPAPLTTQPVVDKSPTEPAKAPSKPEAPAFSIIAEGLTSPGHITLMSNKNVIVKTKVPYKRVNLTPEDVGAVLPLGPNEVLITAKKAGTAQLILWDADDRSQIVDVLVNYDMQGLETQLKGMFPKATIKVESANGAIVLRGHVPDLHTSKQAVDVAVPYGPGGAGTGVLNFLEISGGQQVVLQVRFAEVSRSVSENLGFNAFATDGKFNFGINSGPGGSPPGGLASGTTGGVPATIPLFGSAKAGAASFEVFLNALRANSLLRILAEPNLTAISGEKASFLAGGEFPIPVPQAGAGGTTITIEYKTYGIKLNFTPTVLGDGRVLLHCTPEVSELDYTNAVTLNGYVIPGLTTRDVDTTVELADGQTFALAGLLQNQIKANKNVTPFIGDVPILGALFRSVQYTRSETELVVMVTPRLVEGLNPNQVPRLPGEFWRDPTETQLFFGADLGGPAPDVRHKPAIKGDHFYGPTGFNPAPVGSTPAATK